MSNNIVPFPRLPSIPSSGTGNTFSIGDIYIGDGGFLKILESGQALSGSVSATGSVGTVTVSVS